MPGESLSVFAGDVDGDHDVTGGVGGCVNLFSLVSNADTGNLIAGFEAAALDGDLLTRHNHCGLDRQRKYADAQRGGGTGCVVGSFC